MNITEAHMTRTEMLKFMFKVMWKAFIYLFFYGRIFPVSCFQYYFALTVFPAVNSGGPSGNEMLPCLLLTHTADLMNYLGVPGAPGCGARLQGFVLAQSCHLPFLSPKKTLHCFHSPVTCKAQLTALSCQSWFGTLWCQYPGKWKLPTNVIFPSPNYFSNI